MEKIAIIAAIVIAVAIGFALPGPHHGHPRAKSQMATIDRR